MTYDLSGEAMTIQTIELAGQRFVILPESEFREIERTLASRQQSISDLPAGSHRFEPVKPFAVSGEQASEMLIRERR